MSRASRKERRKGLASQYAAAHPTPTQQSSELPPLNRERARADVPAEPDSSFDELPLTLDEMKTRYKSIGIPPEFFDLSSSDSPALDPLSAPRHGGPVTPEGKARSARNSFKHGLAVTSFSSFKLLPGENPTEYTDLGADLRAQFKPGSRAEYHKIDDMAQSWWLQRRARHLQTNAIEEGNEKLLALYLRYETTQRRSYQMAFKDFQEMKKARLAQQSSLGQPPVDSLGSFQSERVYSSPVSVTLTEPEAPSDHPLAA